MNQADITILIFFLVSIAVAIPTYFYTHPRSGRKK
jgi:hypothetical protein